LNDIKEVYLHIICEILDNISLCTSIIHVSGAPTYLLAESLGKALMLPERWLTHWAFRVTRAKYSIALLDCLSLSYRNFTRYK